VTSSDGQVVLFASPGAFTPTCSDYTSPVSSFVRRAAGQRGRHHCLLVVNDAFVMDAWGSDQEVGDEIVMLADGNGTFTRAMGLEFDASGSGLGERPGGTRLSSTTGSSQRSWSSRPGPERQFG